MRRTITIQGTAFVIRPFTQRDLMRANGSLGILPTDPGEGDGIGLTVKRCDQVDRLLALCVKSPRLLLDEPDEVPEGSLPVAELSDKAWTELVAAISDASGWTAEAAAEVRPISGTVGVS